MVNDGCSVSICLCYYCYHSVFQVHLEIFCSPSSHFYDSFAFCFLFGRIAVGSRDVRLRIISQRLQLFFHHADLVMIVFYNRLYGESLP